MVWAKARIMLLADPDLKVGAIFFQQIVIPTVVNPDLNVAAIFF
jgi:hypothetical protein